LPLLNAQIIMVCILELIFNFKISTGLRHDPGRSGKRKSTIIMLPYDTAFKFFHSARSVMAVLCSYSCACLRWRMPTRQY
jgi:ABC-type sugar transport system permease subunit